MGRIRSIAVPPAWTDVWISPSARGHIQATGRDARGRKQYRYHRLWSQVRDEAKFERTIAFARALPRLRRRVDRDLRRKGVPRDRVLGAIVRLLETTLVRVGNEEYARDNRSFGLTTLRNRHATVRGGTLKFSFRGKSGVQHLVGIRDRRVANVIRKLQELPGQRLFEYVDEDGNVQPIDSDDVNAYIRDAMGADFSAKDFRTWAGTLLAARALRDIEADKRGLKQAIEAVAAEARQHPNGVPQLLHPSGGHRLVSGWNTRRRAWRQRLAARRGAPSPIAAAQAPAAAAGARTKGRVKGAQRILIAASYKDAHRSPASRRSLAKRHAAMSPPALIVVRRSGS